MRERQALFWRSFLKKGKIVNSICFQEEKARKTSFIEREHTQRVCDRTKNEVFWRFLPWKRLLLAILPFRLSVTEKNAPNFDAPSVFTESCFPVFWVEKRIDKRDFYANKCKKDKHCFEGAYSESLWLKKMRRISTHFFIKTRLDILFSTPKP